MPFTRDLGPLEITLENFQTDPDIKNPYSFLGVTDAGEKFAWSGHSFLDPLRSRGDLAFENIALNKYAPLYQDFVRFVTAIPSWQGHQSRVPSGAIGRWR